MSDPPPKRHDSRRSETPLHEREESSNSLDELLVTVGDLSVARLHGDYANQELERCRADHKNAVKIQNYASLIELRESALKRAEFGVKQQQEKVNALSVRAKNLRSVVLDGRNSTEDQLIARLAETVKNSVLTELQQKDIQIKDLKLRVEKFEEAQISRDAVFKQEINAFKTAIGVSSKEAKDRIQDVHDRVETKMSTITSEIHTVKKSYDLQATKFSTMDERYALSEDLEHLKTSTDDFSIEHAEALSRLTKQMDSTLKDVKTIRALNENYSGLSVQLKSLSSSINQSQSASTNKGHETLSASFESKLDALRLDVEEVKQELGTPGDDENAEPSGIWQYILAQIGSCGDENGLGRKGLWGYVADVGFSGREDVTTGLFAAVEKLQEDFEAVGKLQEDFKALEDSLTAERQDTKLLVENRNAELSARFDTVIKDVVEKQNTEIAKAYDETVSGVDFQVFQDDVQASISTMEAKSLELSENFRGLGKRIEKLDGLLPEWDMALKGSARHEVRLTHLEESALSARKQLQEVFTCPPTQASLSGMDAKYDDIKNDLEVIQEVCRSLEDRYNNTTSEDIVSRMLVEFNARHGFQAYINQVSTAATAFDRLQGDVSQSKQRLHAFSEDLVGRFSKIEGILEEHKVSLTNSMKDGSLEDSRVQTLHETFRKQVEDVSNRVDSGLQLHENQISKISVLVQKNSESCDTCFATTGNRIADVESQWVEGEKRIAAIEAKRMLELEESRRWNEASERKSLILNGNKTSPGIYEEQVS